MISDKFLTLTHTALSSVPPNYYSFRDLLDIRKWLNRALFGDVKACLFADFELSPDTS